MISLAQFNPHKRAFWIGLVLILLIGAWLRFSSFDFKLPYIDHPDEPSLYVETLAKRGQVNPIANMVGYPPASLVQTDIVLRFLERSRTPSASDVVYGNRLISVVANLVTLVTIGMLARAVAGDVAGLVAALGWAISPLVLEHGVFGLADPLVYMLATLSVYLAALPMLKPKRHDLLVWSTVVALLATLYKYPAVVMLFPSGIAALWLLRKDRRVLRTIALQALLVSIVAVYLLVIYSAANMDMKVVNNSRDSLIDNLFVPARLLANLWWLASPLNAVAVAVVLSAGAGAVAVAVIGRRPRVRLVPLVLIGLTAVIFAWVVSSFSTPETTGRIRDVMPVTSLACVLVGAAVGQILLVFPQRTRLVAGVVLVTLLGLFVFLPLWTDSLRLLQLRERVDRRVALYQYVDTNLEPGTIIVDSWNHKTFNPFFSGMQGRHWYDWQETDNILRRSVTQWIDAGLTYAAISNEQYESLQQSAEGRAFLEQMLYLRTLDEPSNGDGPRTMMYRLWDMDHREDIHFSQGIQLIGYDISATIASPGENLELRFYWHADMPPPADYSLFIHLTKLGEQVPLTQADGAPARPERLTVTWDDPDETIIGQRFTLALPEALEPGTYELQIGLYDYITGQRLTIEHEGAVPTDKVLLSAIEVVEPD